MKDKILALDESTNLNGYCLYDGDIIQSGVIEIKKACVNDADYIDRIVELLRVLGIQIQEFEPNIICLEEVTLQQDKGLGNRRKDGYGARGFKTFAKLTENVGNIKTLARVNDVQIITVYPSEWRSPYGISKNRNQAKKQAVDVVNSEFNLDLKYNQDDEAEAILIAKYVYENKL